MLLEGVNFDEFEREGGDNTLSPKRKTTVVEKRKRKEEEEKEKEKFFCTLFTTTFHGGHKLLYARRNRGGKHIENAVWYTTVISTIIFNADFRQEHHNN